MLNSQGRISLKEFRQKETFRVEGIKHGKSLPQQERKVKVEVYVHLVLIHSLEQLQKAKI